MTVTNSFNRLIAAIDADGNIQSAGSMTWQNDPAVTLTGVVAISYTLEDMLAMPARWPETETEQALYQRLCSELGVEA